MKQDWSVSLTKREHAMHRALFGEKEKSIDSTVIQLLQ